MRTCFKLLSSNERCISILLSTPKLRTSTFVRLFRLTKQLECWEQGLDVYSMFSCVHLRTVVDSHRWAATDIWFCCSLSMTLRTLSCNTFLLRWFCFPPFFQSIISASNNDWTHIHNLHYWKLYAFQSLIYLSFLCKKLMFSACNSVLLYILHAFFRSARLSVSL